MIAEHKLFFMFFYSYFSIIFSLAVDSLFSKYIVVSDLIHSGQRIACYNMGKKIALLVENKDIRGIK